MDFWPSVPAGRGVARRHSGYDGPMSESRQDDENDSSTTTSEDGEQRGVTDEQLPEDLQPTEDNPLARHPDQTGDDDDRIGADREEDPETAPLREEDADYGSGESSPG